MSFCTNSNVASNSSASPQLRMTIRNSSEGRHESRQHCKCNKIWRKLQAHNTLLGSQTDGGSVTPRRERLRWPWPKRWYIKVVMGLIWKVKVYFNQNHTWYNLHSYQIVPCIRVELSKKFRAQHNAGVNSSTAFQHGPQNLTPIMRAICQFSHLQIYNNWGRTMSSKV